MAAKPHLTVFGFAVYFHPFAMVGAALIVLIMREVGVLIAATFAVSILVHELGHSFAFRHYGTESHIVIHPFGGYSMPDAPQKLDHKAWVYTSLAGPAAAFFLLGLPAWCLREFGVLQYGYGEFVARFTVYFCIYWGAVNLLPIWPLDGGKVLYHGTDGNWELTKIITVLVSVPAIVLAVNLGFRFAVIFVAFNAYRVITGPAPGRTANSGNSRVNTAAKRAKAYAFKPTKTRGRAGAEAIDGLYRDLLRGRPDRAAEPLAALRKSKYRDAAELAYVWGEVIAGYELTAGHTSSPLLETVLANDRGNTALVLHSSEASLEWAAAMRVLHQRGSLDEVCHLLAKDEAGREQLRELERQTLDLGMVEEQVRVTAALSSDWTASNSKACGCVSRSIAPFCWHEERSPKTQLQKRGTLS